MLIIHMLIALVLTDLFEFATAYVLGYRVLQIYIVILLANFITNPALNLIMQLGLNFFPKNVASSWVILLEMLVVILEWRILTYVHPKRSKQMLLLSFAMNCTSFIGGIFIFGT
jgi:hypothetical protein